MSSHNINKHIQNVWYSNTTVKVIHSKEENKTEILNSKYRIDQNAERLFAIVLFMCWVKRFNPSF